LADIIRWSVIMVCPGEDDLPLLAALTSRSDAQVVAVADGDGTSLGAGLAEVMGIPVVTGLDSSAAAAHYLIYPELNSGTASFVDLAPALGLEAVKTRDFIRLLEDPTTGPGVIGSEPLPLLDHEGLELESAAIHRTLSRIEEALDRESLLRWILGLAIRAVGADSGSIMLVDSATDELFVAFAEGLSQQTMLKTRVRMGEGIAGRVALRRKAELINANQHPGARRDRTGNGAAVCSPLVWDGKLLGVLNLSSDRPGQSLRPEALGVVDSLAHRFGLILDRFLRIQRVRDGELFRVMEEGLLREKRNPEALAATLSAWASDLAEVAGADRASLSVLTHDGDLFTAGPEGSAYESPPSEVKSQVLTSGQARVLSPGDLADQDPADSLGDVMIYHLPVGHDPSLALFSLEFGSPARAHQFRSISGDIMALVERHLSDYLERAESADQIDRLTTLVASLSDLSLGGPGQLSLNMVLGAAQRLTGAGGAALLEGGDDGPQSTASSSMEPDLIAASRRLLVESGQRGWKGSILATESGQSPGPCAVLAVPLEKGRPFPGIILWDKERLHPLDAASFTEMDVLFVQRLLPLLTMAHSVVPEPVPAGPDHGQAELAAALKREMDRCDRYHTCLGLTAYRVEDGNGLRLDQYSSDLSQHLRSSDQVFRLDPLTLAVLNPEDVQSLPRLQARVNGILRSLAGKPDLELRSAARTYPGSANSPSALLDSLLSALN